jgi:hypothetical protein
VSPVEGILALVFLALAVRSAIYWARHPVDTDDAVDDLLFAAFVTGRVGTWLLASGMFVLFGSISVRGRAYTDEARQFAWLVLVFFGLGGMQLLAAWFLGARGARDDDPDASAAEEPGEPDEPDEPPSRRP